MNYYEELGVRCTASSEEIREAYLRLVRLLHPDQIQDQATRRLAERQLQRLNGIMEVLADPARRRQYDLSLGQGTRTAILRWVSSRPEGVWPTTVWCLLAGLAAGGVLYYFAAAGSASRPDSAGAVPPAAAAQLSAGQHKPSVQPAPVARGQPPRRDPRTGGSIARRNPLGLQAEFAPPAVIRQPNADLAEGQSRQQADPGVAPESDTGGDSAPDPAGRRQLLSSENNPAARPASSAAETAPEAPARSGLVGLWLYVPGRVPTNSPLFYAPEYIELRIVEEAGRLIGRYRARYRVADRAISPDVRFDFEGEDGQSIYRWQGPGGSYGEVRLKLERPNALEVTWWASELGSYLGLASGMAVLRRQ